jgi:hypothetical protein
VQIHGLSPGQAAAFAYHGAMKLQPINTDGKCTWLIVDADAESSLSNVNMLPWRFVTKVRRPTDDNEDVLLYRRIN